MLVLFESAAGFAVFKVLDKKKLKNVDNLAEEFLTPESAANVVELAGYHKFNSSAEALDGALAMTEGKLVKPLKSLLKEVVSSEVNEKLMVLDAKLGKAISKKLANLEIVCNSTVSELVRCIRGQMESLIPGVSAKDNAIMALGIGHNLARYKLKFSPDKVDTMVVQAVSLLDDLDKELNNYIMRAKEWYGWHFPELAKILPDNVDYINTINTMGVRSNARTCNLESVLTKEKADSVMEAAEVSMGCEITDMDIEYMQGLCDQIHGFTEYRKELAEYLVSRMVALAPNVSTMVGELIGARLISHAGTLVNLAKFPASTIQLIGAEKALFRALKTSKPTPKYGLIFHADLVNKVDSRNKGKMSRMLAAKTALASRIDALADVTMSEPSEHYRTYLLKKARYLENNSGQAAFKQNRSFKSGTSFQNKPASSYDERQDSTAMATKRPHPEDDAEDDTQPKRKKAKKEKKEESLDMEVTAEPEETTEKKKKKKKDRTNDTADDSVVAEESPKKKKKKKHAADETLEADQTMEEEPSTEGKKKKKKKNKTKDQE